MRIVANLVSPLLNALKTLVREQDAKGTQMLNVGSIYAVNVAPPFTLITEELLAVSF